LLWYRQKMSCRAENMKNEHNALGRQKRIRQYKTWKLYTTSLKPLKMNVGVQNLKIGHNSLETIENESRIRKLENWTQWFYHYRKWVMHRKMWTTDTTPSKTLEKSSTVQNFKIRCNAPVIVKNECMSTKYENWT
jgi:hypothetical protein